MIDNKIEISIDAQPEAIFHVLDTMPNKFPIYNLLETKPFLFLRILLFDGYKSAVEALKFQPPTKELILDVGSAMGPFTLIDKQNPSKYWFKLESLCFNCRTGYTIRKKTGHSILNLDLIAELPTKKERFWWFLAKPVHVLFTKKVLRNIKNTVEKELNSQSVKVG